MSRREEQTEVALLSLVGLVLGAAAGAVAYVSFVSYIPLTSPVTMVQHVLRLAWPPTPSALAFEVLGALVGLALASLSARAAPIRGLVRGVFGSTLGAFAGFLTYSAGYVAATYPTAPFTRAFPLYLAEAAYSLTLVEFLCVGVGAAVGLAVARQSWRFQGVLGYIALFTVVVGYIAYTVVVTLPRVPPNNLPLSLVLFGAEAASLAMVVLFSFYNLDVSVRKRWRRGPQHRAFSKYFLPKVAFHVAVYNEPPGLVIATLESLQRVAYPRDRYVIMVADDSTRPELREPLERYCAERGLWYHHREDRRGFKAGALNEALAATPDDADLIAVIDADYQIEPTYLQETVGHFVNPRLGFLQTPQDYRNLQQSFLARQYYVADAYFYRAVLPSRNEGNAIIFCGTMGIIRRTALEQVGGWGEGYITEDAELSARILRAKWESLYVNKTYGRGLMPATFDGYKKQLHRWAFGGVQILKGHAGDLFRRGLTSRQKLDFLVGGIHWFDGVYIVIIALALATMGIADLLGRQVVTHHARELGLVALIPIFLLVDGLARLHLALKPSLRLPLGATFGVMGMWYATKFNNAHAALKALIGIKMPFVRTPKAPTQRVGAREALGLALKLTRFETFMSIAMLGISLAVVGKTLALWAGTGSVAPARVFLAGWLGYHSLLFATAPIYAYRSYVTFAPDEEPPAEPAAAATFTGFDEREPPARSPLPPSSRPANLTQVPGQPRL